MTHIYRSMCLSWEFREKTKRNVLDDYSIGSTQEPDADGLMGSWLEERQKLGSAKQHKEAVHHKHTAQYYSYTVELTTKTAIQAIPGTPTSVNLLSANCAPYIGSKYTTAKNKSQGWHAETYLREP